MCLPLKKDNSIEPKKHLREERRKIMESMQIKHEKMLSLIDGWNGIGTNDIKKKDMTGMPIGVWIDINEKVSIKRIENQGNILVFDTIMKKGGEFGLHTHSDCIEICEVLKGRLHDLVLNVTFEKGEKLIVEKNIEHLPIALEETLLKVYFD